jgi:hypothetical protein
MALTRPKIWDIDTNIEYFMDPITVLHQGASSANVDVGFLFNRANGLVSNVALYWSETSQSFVTAFTANTGVTNSNIAPTSYANLTVGNVLLVNGTIAINGNLGLAGQYIVSTGSGMAWTTASFNGGTITNALTVTANVTAPQYNFANGTNILSTVTSSYGNTQVAAYLPTYTGTLTYGSVPILNSSSTTTSIGTSPVAIDSFSSTVYRSAKYIVSVTDVTNTGYQTAEILLMQDGVNANIASYGILVSGTGTKMTFTSNIVASTVTLWGTGVSANNTVKLARTLIPV